MRRTGGFGSNAFAEFIYETYTSLGPVHKHGMNNQTTKPGGLWLLIAVICAYCIAFLGWSSQPEIINSFIKDLNLSASSAGLLASLEIVAVAITSFALAPRISRFPLRRLCIIGGVLTLAGNGATAGVTTLATVALARLIAGIGEGCVIAVANAVIAGFRHPDRGYAQVNAVNIVFSMCFLALLSIIGRSYGHVGVFAALAFVCLLFIPALLHIPAAAEASAPSGALNSPSAYAVLLAMLIWGSADGATWAFLLQLGERTELSPQMLSASVASWAVGGFLGAGAAAWLSQRVARMRALTVALILNVIITMFLSHSTSGWIYMVAAFGQIVCVYFVMPYLLGIAAELDPQGGCATAVGGMFMLTGATGPLLGGFLTQWGGYTSLGWNMLVCVVLSFPFLAYAAKAAKENSVRIAAENQ